MTAGVARRVVALGTRRPSAVRGRRTALAVLAAVLGSLMAGCGAGGGAAPAPAPPEGVGTRIDGTIPAAVMHLPLVDQDGRSTSLAAFRGKVLVIGDAMTLCQETCPLDTANLVQTAREANRAGAGSAVEYLSITVDPGRDTPAQLAAFRKQFAPAPANWQLLTGTSADIAKLWKYFGVWYQKVPQGTPPPKNWRTGQPLTYDIEHVDETFFVDGRGGERFVLDGVAHVTPGTVVPPTLHGFLDDRGRQNLAHPAAGSWTVAEALQTVGWLLGHPLTVPGG